MHNNERTTKEQMTANMTMMMLPYVPIKNVTAAAKALKTRPWLASSFNWVRLTFKFYYNEFGLLVPGMNAVFREESCEILHTFLEATCYQARTDHGSMGIAAYLLAANSNGFFVGVQLDYKECTRTSCVCGRIAFPFSAIPFETNCDPFDTQAEKLRMTIDDDVVI